MNSSKFHIPTIPIIGGDCGGKTTMLAVGREHAIDLGFTPLFGPEAATHCFSMGIDPKIIRNNLELQISIFELQLFHEDFLMKKAQLLAEKGEKPVVFLDRTLIDGKAYSSQDEWMIIQDQFNMPEGKIFSRYPHVIHLDTAPEKFFNYDNPYRTKRPYSETWELNERLKNIYLDCHLHVISNRGDFEVKKDDFKSAFLRIMGYPEPIEDEVKYVLLDRFEPENIPVPCRESIITQEYLVPLDEDWVERIRTRKFADGVVIYTHTLKHRPTKVERESIIHTMRELIDLRKRINPKKKPVMKRRCCFLWEAQYFELDFFIAPKIRPLLELERTNIDRSILIPGWLGRVQDVTNDPQYRNEAFADYE